MRLAEHVEHTTDVDGMLQGMTVDQFNEWCIKDKIEPIGHGQRMLGLIAYMLACYLSSGHAVKPGLLMPWLDTSSRPEIDNAAAKALLNSVLGAPNEELI